MVTYPRSAVPGQSVRRQHPTSNSAKFNTFGLEDGLSRSAQRGESQSSTLERLVSSYRPLHGGGVRPEANLMAHRTSDIQDLEKARQNTGGRYNFFRKKRSSRGRNRITGLASINDSRLEQNLEPLAADERLHTIARMYEGHGDPSNPMEVDEHAIHELNNPAPHPAEYDDMLDETPFFRANNFNFGDMDRGRM